MVWVGVLCLLVAAAFLGLALFQRERDARAGMTVIGSVCTAVGVVILLFSSYVVVRAGNVGVPILFGEVQDRTIESGLHQVNPFVSVEQLSTRTENYWLSHQEHEASTRGDDSVSVRSTDGLQMPVDVSAPYRLIPEAAPWVYRNLGPDYVQKLLRVSLSAATRRAASHYTAEELYSTKRDEFAERIRTLLAEELTRLLQDNYKGKGAPEQVLAVSQVLVGHVGIPDAVRNAIEAKLKADQEQQAMGFQIMREEKEAKRKKVEAEGIKTFQDIVTTGISDKLLRWKAIDATLKLAESHNTKVIVIGAGKDGLPVLLGGDGEVTIPTHK